MQHTWPYKSTLHVHVNMSQHIIIGTRPSPSLFLYDCEISWGGEDWEHRLHAHTFLDCHTDSGTVRLSGCVGDCQLKHVQAQSEAADMKNGGLAALLGGRGEGGGGGGEGRGEGKAENNVTVPVHLNTLYSWKIYLQVFL